MPPWLLFLGRSTVVAGALVAFVCLGVLWKVGGVLVQLASFVHPGVPVRRSFRQIVGVLSPVRTQEPPHLRVSEAYSFPPRRLGWLLQPPRIARAAVLRPGSPVVLAEPPTKLFVVSTPVGTVALGEGRLPPLEDPGCDGREHLQPRFGVLECVR